MQLDQFATYTLCGTISIDNKIKAKTITWYVIRKSQAQMYFAM